MGVMMAFAVLCLTTALAIRGSHLLHGHDWRPHGARPAPRREPISTDEMNAFLWDLYRTNDLVDRLRREPRA
jgi:hypothetical protein